MEEFRVGSRRACINIFIHNYMWPQAISATSATTKRISLFSFKEELRVTSIGQGFRHSVTATPAAISRIIQV